MVDSYIFFNKGDALIHASKTGKDVTWYFNDDIFSAIDWSIPIDTSLTELYKQRAQQLRDKYDYVSLFFSGGVDSTNALHAFIDNDIFLDEIVTYRPRYIEETVNSIDTTSYNLYSETILAVVPHLTKYITDHRTKIRIIYLDDALDRFVSDPVLLSQFPNLSHFTPTTLCNLAMMVTDLEWNKLYSSGKNVCHIRGADKPLIKANKLNVFKFHDISSTIATEPKFHTNLSDMISTHQFQELFYWTPDLPQLVIKQCQVVKKLCESSSYFYSMFNSAATMTQDNLVPMLPHIYPSHVTDIRNLFTTSSPGSNLYSPHNIWFYEHMPVNITSIFENMVQRGRENIDDRFFRPLRDDPLGTSLYFKNPLYKQPKSAYQGFWSKTYIL